MSTANVTKLVAEVLLGGDTHARVTQVALEVLTPSITPSPTTPTGAGVTKVALEALIDGVPRAVVSTVQLEVLLSDATPAPGGSSPAATVHVSGYAG